MSRSPHVAAALAALCVALLSAVPAAANPVITEVAWMGSDGDANDEWIEIFNPGSQPEDLSTYVLIQNTTVRPLPAQTLNDGAYLVLERQASSTTLETPAAVIFSFGAGLVNGGQPLCLCAAAATSCADASCDVVNTGSAWFAGDNTAPKATMERKDAALPGNLASSWQDGSPSSPGAAAPPAVDAGPEPVDAGPEPVDAGPPPPDAGPNTLPTLSVAEPASTVTGPTVDVVYSAADTDPGDAVSVDLYWSADTSGQEGVRFARGLPSGSNLHATLDTASVPVGTWYVFGRAHDTRGGEVFAYAPGAVQVGEGGQVEPVFELTEPDGVDDNAEDGIIAVQWRVELPPGAAGSVSLYVDDDDDGADGEPLIAGLSAAAEGPRAYLWDPTLTGTAAGPAWVYGVLDWSGGQVVSYAPASATVAAEGCSCGQGRGSGALRLPAGLTLAILLLPFVRRGADRRRG